LLGPAVLEGRVMNVADVTAAYRFVPGQREQGFRSVLWVPMLRDGESIGVIGVSRAEVGEFPESQVALLRTFADQAVIALDNARLFAELAARNRELGEALTQQTATSEILGVISRSPTDIQPVLDAVTESAARLSEASDTSVFRLEGDRLVLVAHYGSMSTGPVGEFSVGRGRGSAVGRSVVDRRTIHVADMQA